MKFQIEVDKKELGLFRLACQAKGKSPSDFLRDIIKNYPAKVFTPAVLAELNKTQTTQKMNTRSKGGIK